MQKVILQKEKALHVGQELTYKEAMKLGVSSNMQAGETVKVIQISSTTKETRDDNWVYDRVTIGLEVIDGHAMGTQFAEYKNCNWRKVQA
jgi:hypothetical protein